MGSERGSTPDMDDAIGYGFNLTYNNTNRLALGFDRDWLSPDYRAVCRGRLRLELLRFQYCARTADRRLLAAPVVGIHLRRFLQHVIGNRVRLRCQIGMPLSLSQRHLPQGGYKVWELDGVGNVSDPSSNGVRGECGRGL